jgi:hypothetical protein
MWYYLRPQPREAVEAAAHLSVSSSDVTDYPPSVSLTSLTVHRLFH